MNTGPGMSRDVFLSKDLAFRLRHIRPEDAPHLCEFVAGLSVETRQQRFFCAIRELAPDFLHYLTVVDGLDHVAIVAVDLTDPGARFLGVARFVRCETDPRVAELAITIADQLQRRGIGRVLTRAVAEAAEARGVDRFRCEVLRSNHPMRAFLAAHDAHLRHERQGEMSFEFDLAPLLKRPLPPARASVSGAPPARKSAPGVSPARPSSPAAA